LPQEERINNPANPDQYWQYRMHLTLEQLIGEDSFNQAFSASVSQTGRR
jgi:4-alpha-glucanotransferase